MSDFQENQKQLTNSGIQHSTTSQSIQGSSSQSQSGTLYNRDESTVKNNGDYQKNQDQLVQQLQSKIKELTDVLKEKEVEMSMTLQGNKIQLTDLQDQNSKNMKIIQNLNQQNFELKDQLAQLQMNAQLQEKEMQNLKTQIEELKIENGTQNFRAHNKIQINDVSDQKYQGQEENQQELINFQPKKHEIALLSFNDSAEMYKNKCGHMIEKNKLESLLIQAVKNNQIVKCETCNSNFSATICQDIGMIGENYLKIKSTLELSQMYNNYKPLQKSHLSVVSCENPSCNFFCFYQTANHYDDSDYSYCPNCLIRSVNNPKEVPNIITF
ncbi:unnamed protein product (macronuclear) [Paramecium tetraurelia]|uniref:Uncharacterized protein n=1 Tax=Paramecium tetraurelia TaxID=5888 RepID=A0C7S0_PARTE|nr:uncharacterized protein GSPATT00035968001 [Paramecium tetraurelia]CAK66837.1 unnamed protein product [Paramecium tetraurelia]|eukprot:XP_001434234.1 hypothetical protein (macronuclear) [Paramecium tetraurelia strain d4-2]